MTNKKIALGADHAGFANKEYIREQLAKEGLETIDHGTWSVDSVDYPDFAHRVAEDVLNNKAGIGILFCGSGNGVAIAANRHHGIRAALCWTPEIAEMARKHNDANILCIPSRYVSNETSAEMVKIFLETAFEGGRHARRVEKIEL
jgi:ribose 5-phosphate isomerase B